MKRYGWVKYLRKSWQELPYDSPIYIGNHSNGEYFHTQTPYERKLRQEILRVGDEKARRLGMDRREFMASAMGMCTALGVIQACSSGSDAGGAGASSGNVPSLGAGASGAAGVAGTPALAGQAAPPAGGMPVAGADPAAGASPAGPAAGDPAVAPPTAGDPMASDPPMPGGGDPSQPGQYCFATDSGIDPTMCEDAARAALAPPTFIFDGQTHTFDDAPDAAWRSSPPPGFNDNLALLLGARCASDDKVSCIGPDDYARLMFLESDTTMTVLSTWPYGQGPNDPNSNAFIASTRDWINADLAGSQRVVNHASVVPPFGTGQMQQWSEQLGVGGWKIYPASFPNFFMDDMTGRAIIENAITAGVKTFAIHKGLPIYGFSTEHNMPTDIGPVAKDYPDVNFIIYHSAICSGQPASGFTCSPVEGDYVEGSLDGTDALITSMKQNGIGPNQNVYAELGGAFSQMLFNPGMAGTWLAKMVEHIGENNIIWGTDSILSGNSPQGQIQAFMGLSHPALTPDVKAKILGLNGARLYCVDVAAKRCQVDASKLAMHKREIDDEFGEYRWVLLGHQRPLGPTTRREFLRLRNFYRVMGIPG